MAVSVEFFPLAALRSATAATRVELEKIRSIAGAVRKKIAEISNRSQFTPAFIAAESGRIREQGMAEAKAYLEQRETMPRVQQIASQEPLWNTDLQRSAVSIRQNSRECRLRHRLRRGRIDRALHFVVSAKPNQANEIINVNPRQPLSA